MTVKIYFMSNNLIIFVSQIKKYKGTNYYKFKYIFRENTICNKFNIFFQINNVDSILYFCMYLFVSFYKFNINNLKYSLTYIF